MLASLKMSEARSKRTATTTTVEATTTNTSGQQQQQPLAPPQKRIRFTARVPPLGELLDSFPTDEHLLHALTRSATADDYGGPETLVQQLLSLALGSAATNIAGPSSTTTAPQSRPAAEIALRALRLIASSHCPLYSASIIQLIFDRCLSLAQSSTSDESTDLCASLLSICAECAKIYVALQQQFILVLVEILGKSDCNFLILTECLRLLARFFARECSSRHLSRLCSICVDLLLIGDVRVRLASLDLLNEMLHHCSRNASVVAQIPIKALYKSAIPGLDDSYEDIRLAALSIIATLGSLQPDLQIEDEMTSKVAGSNNTLANVVFGRLCHACASDRTIRVRALAALLMGRLPGISENFIEQSLDKKTIASMRVDDGAQPQKRAGYGVAIGDYEVDAVSLISQSACGALVHALEDEFYEVREAGIESLSRMITPERLSFARHGQDFLVDALGDEIESVVLCALRALARAGSQLDFTEKHVSAILFTLKVASSTVRRQVHRTLSSITLRSRASHLACCLALVDNIRMFPSDTDSIWTCCAHFGRHHSQLTRGNLARLLDMHPIFLSQETKMDDPTYIAKLLIIFAAAGADGTSSQIMRSLPEHVRSHYGYISARFRHLLYELGPSLLPLVKNDDGASSSSSSPSKAVVRAHRVAVDNEASSSQLRLVLVRHVELLRNSLLSSPSLDRSVDLATSLMRHSVNQGSNSLSTSAALSLGSCQFDYSDQFAPQWRFLMGLIHCLFDYSRIRKMAGSSSSSSSSTERTSSSSGTVADNLAQARSILFTDLRPRLVRLLNCFVPVPSSFVALLRLMDVAACSAAGVGSSLLHHVALLAKAAFQSADTPMPSVVERVLLYAASSMGARKSDGAAESADIGSALVPRQALFDDALVASLVSCLSDDLLLTTSTSRMTELRVEIREPIPLVSEPAAEVRFVSHFGATVPLRFVVSGFRRDRLAAAMPRLVVRVTYPNQRSDILAPLSSEIEVIGEDEHDKPSSSSSSSSTSSDESVVVSVSMRIPIAFTSSTGPCHARVSVLLSSRDDGLVDLTSIENGGSGPLQLLVHSKPAKGEMQKRLLSVAIQP